MASSSRKRVNVNDPDFENFVLSVLDEEGSDADEPEEANEDYNSEHETASEQEDVGENLEDENNVGLIDNDESANSYYGRNRYKWSSTEPARNVRTPRHNIVLQLPGIKGRAKELGDSCSTLQSWECLFSEDMINQIVTCTNVKLQSYKSKYSTEDRTELRDTNSTEMKSFLGVLYYTAIFKSNKESLESMFATDGSGRDIFRACISKSRLMILLICLRFDDSTDREERKKENPAAAISWLFSRMVQNSQQCYSIGAMACIDEMLVGFRGRCRFRMYMAQKPEKYGLKIMILCDAKTHYLLNAYIYTGRDSDGVGVPQEERQLLKPTQSVLRLSQPIYGSNRNITADNYFSSIELVSELKRKNLTYVGTLKKNKREIPPEFLPNRRRNPQSSLYGFTKDTTILSYVPKKNKAVILISTMHHSKEDDCDIGKPEIISFYNSTKGGVDALDQKCVTYSTSRRTRRWPMAIFYAILNITAVNAYVLHSSYKNNKQYDRFDFMKDLAKSLTEPFLRERLVNSRIPRELRFVISRILGAPLPCSEENRAPLAKRKRCHFCPRSQERKSNVCCVICDRPVCLHCRSVVCRECSE